MRAFQARAERRRANAASVGPVNWDPSNPNHQNVRPGSLGILEAQDVNAPLRPPTQRIVEVRDAGHMGLGLFAKENIPRGARILAELPLFDMPAEQPLPNLVGEDLALYQELCLDNEYQDLEDFIKEVDLVGIDSQNIKTMETLYCNEEAARDEYNKHAIKNFIFRKIKIQWAIDCAKAGPYHRAPIPASRLERLRSPDPDRLARLWAIWNNNRVKLGQFATRDSGVFLLASRINHSCCPNAWYEFNPTTGRLYDQQAEMLTTHAIRDIKAGEQILVGYDAVSLKLRPERVEKLATWNVYNCICALCTNPVVEALQQRAYVLWQAADFWVRPRPSSQQQLVKQGIAPCKDAYEALKMGEEVIALLTHPIWNVRDSSSAEAFKLCSIICERIANDPKSGLSYDEAVGYWTRAMRFSSEKTQVYMMLAGTDGREMSKADHRFRALQQRRERWTALQNGWQWPPRR